MTDDDNNSMGVFGWPIIISILFWMVLGFGWILFCMALSLSEPAL